MPTGNLERDIGRIEGDLRAQKERMDRTDAANAEQFRSIHGRFDDVAAHLNKQDEALSTILKRTAREDGANGVLGSIFGGAGQLSLAAISGGLSVKIAEWMGWVK